jgi:hypothetical protein
MGVCVCCIDAGLVSCTTKIRNTRYHHRANPLVPHLLTVRVTFHYFAAQSFDDSLPFKVNEHPTRFDDSLKPAV